MYCTFDIDTDVALPDFEVDFQSFKKVMSCLGDHFPAGELEAIFGEIDTSGDGVLEFHEFAVMWTDKSTRAQRMLSDRINELKHLFVLFDDDGGGELDLAEIQSIMKRLGRKPADEELADALRAHAGLAAEFDIEKIALNVQAFNQLMCGSQSLVQKKLRKQLKDFREAFQLFDADGSGEVRDDCRTHG